MKPQSNTAEPAGRRIDRLGDIFASGALSAVSNTTERLCLMANAVVSGSHPQKYNYRKHWYSDSSIGAQIGRRRESVNKAQARLQGKAIINRSALQKGGSRLTELAEYAELAAIAEKHGGQTTDIKPAPKPTGAPFLHFPDELLKSGILEDLPGAAGELLLLAAWLAQPDPAAEDFGSYAISAAAVGAVLYRDKRTIARAFAFLTSNNLIARDGKTITLQAHDAAQLAARWPGRPARTPARPFDEGAQLRCTLARQERGAVVTPPEKGAVVTSAAAAERGAVVTPLGARSSHPLGRGRHTRGGAVVTRTTKEPLKTTIRENHVGASKTGGNSSMDQRWTPEEAQVLQSIEAAPDDRTRRILVGDVQQQNWRPAFKETVLALDPQRRLMAQRRAEAAVPSLPAAAADPAVLAAV